MVESEERKSAGNLDSYLKPTGSGINEGLATIDEVRRATDTEQEYYSDLMDLIYTGDGTATTPDGQPTVLLEDDMNE